MPLHVDFNQRKHLHAASTWHATCNLLCILMPCLFIFSICFYFCHFYLSNVHNGQHIMYAFIVHFPLNRFDSIDCNHWHSPYIYYSKVKFLRGQWYHSVFMSRHHIIDFHATIFQVSDFLLSFCIGQCISNFYKNRIIKSFGPEICFSCVSTHFHIQYNTNAIEISGTHFSEVLSLSPENWLIAILKVFRKWIT